MASWRESALEPSNDEETIPKPPAKLEEIPADATVEVSEARAKAWLEHLGVAAGDPEPITLELGPIGRAAMDRRLPLWKLIDIIPFSDYDQREIPGNGPYSRGRGL